MSAIIRRKKRLFEADENAANTLTTNAPQQAQQPAQNAQPAQPAQNTAPVATANSNAPADANQQQLNQQNAQQSQQQADPKVAELQKKVTDCINNISEIIKKNDPYQLIALDMPSKIQESVPEFKGDNPTAKDAISAWEEFKKNASKETFEKFMTSFATFGNGGQPVDANANANNQQAQQPAQNAQPTQSTQPTQTPNNSAPAQNAVQGQQLAESVNMQFRDQLLENLQNALKRDRYEKILQNGWQDPEVLFG